MTNDELLSQQPPVARDHACSALLPSSCSALTISINFAFEARRKRRIVNITEKRVKHFGFEFRNLSFFSFLKLRLLLLSVAISIVTKNGTKSQSVITQTYHFEFSLLRRPPDELLSHIHSNNCPPTESSVPLLFRMFHCVWSFVRWRFP